MSMHKKKLYLLAGFLVALAPATLFAQLSGSTFKLDPGGQPSSVHSSTSTNYKLDGSVEWMSGVPTSTNYSLESGATIAGGCGDSIVDPSESCDGSNLNGATCVTQGFSSGTLSCSSSCAFVTSSCTTTTTSSSGGGGGGGGSSSTTTTTPTVSAPTTGEAPEKPTVDKQFSKDYFTYENSTLLFGKKTPDADEIEVNGKDTGVTYPNETSWRVKVKLVVGDNGFTIKAVNEEGKSKSLKVTIHRRPAGDVDGNGKVNDYDLSKFIRLFGKVDAVADFNSDNKVDDYDLSRLVANFESGS